MKKILSIVLIVLFVIGNALANPVNEIPNTEYIAENSNSKRNIAYLNAFIENDPLAGDNGMETSPAAPLIYGPINIAFDIDGNAIEAVDEQDLFYADGYYYLIGQSFAEGS